MVNTVTSMDDAKLSDGGTFSEIPSSKILPNIGYICPYVIIVDDYSLKSTF